MTRHSESRSLLAVSFLLVGALEIARAQETVTLFFDDSGAEAGVTSPGTAEFSFRGSNWSGGVVATERITPLYASGSFSYEIEGGMGRVTFDSPVDRVEFFFVHGFGFPQGTATAFDGRGDPVASETSGMATVFGDPRNFVTLDPEGPIAGIEFTGGVIDNFTFTTLPPATPAIASGDIRIELEEVAGGLSSPVFLTHAGDGSGRLFVVDQAGLIRVIEDGALLEAPFLDLTSKIVALNDIFDERGALGLTFHPDYEANGRFFVRYSAPREGDPAEPCNDPDGFVVGCHRAVLAEYRVSAADPNAADPASERILFEVDEPEFNHNAGQVVFGPDGFLYFSLGDGGGRDDGLSGDPPLHGPTGNGQNLQTPLGALLRIDVDAGDPFAVPADNPFVGEEGLDEIYAYGFRNPYRFSFDRETGEIFLADVGQDLFEEVDVVVKGGNYGWAIREGANCFDPADPNVPPDSCPADGLIDPVAEYDHSEGLAVVGGFVYRGSRFPDLVGKYVFGDFSRDFGPTGRLFYLDADGDRSQIFEFQLGPSSEPLGLFVLGFGEDEEGELYVLTSAQLGPAGASGAVFRIVSAGGLQAPGDCNQDGAVDISDPVCVFGALFLGSASLPCGSGLAADEGNIGLIDWQPDGGVDISDGIAALQFLFLGGPAHHLAVPGAETSGCVPIPGCPRGPPSCP